MNLTSGACRVWLVCVLAAGCSSASEDVDGGRVVLTATNVVAHDEIGAIVAGTGHEFLELDATISNQTPSPIATSYALFTVTTDAGFVIDADGVSCEVDPDCSPASPLAIGDDASHTLVFHVPTILHAVALGYGDGLGHTGSVPIHP